MSMPSLSGKDKLTKITQILFLWSRSNPWDIAKKITLEWSIISAKQRLLKKLCICWVIVQEKQDAFLNHVLIP